MKKHQTIPALSYGDGGAIPRSRALVALPRAAPRRGILGAGARALVGILLLPVRIPVLAIVGMARGAAWIGSGAGRAGATIGHGLYRGGAALVVGIARLVAAPFVLGARLLVGTARLLGLALGGAGRGGAAVGRGLLRGIAALLVGIVRLVTAPFVLGARLLVGMARLLGLALGGAGRGGAAVGHGLVRGIAAILVGVVRLVVAPFVLGARLLVGTARLLGLVLRGAGRGVPMLGRGLVRGIAAIVVGVARLVVAPFVLGARLLVGTARLLGLVLSVVARGALWLGSRAGRGLAVLARLIVVLPVRVVVLLARLVALVLLIAARVVVFVLRLPFLALRLAGRGAVGAGRGLGFATVAVAVPVGALAWGAVRYLGAGVAAVVRGVAAVLAFAGRLLLRGLVALCRGGLSGIFSLARGAFACVRVICRLALWIAKLPFVVVRALVLALARGAWHIAGLLIGAAATVATGFAEVLRGVAALARLLGRTIAGAARPIGAALGSKNPTSASLLPLAALALVAGAEMFGSGGFPFATVGILIVAAFASLSALQRPTSTLAVLLAWGVAVTTGWRAERVSLDTPAWLDALVYLSALAALRSAYVAARSFVRETPAAWRAPEQERAHRRASRAIGIVLAVQCVLFGVWSAAEGRLFDAPLFGELLLVGAGMVLAWVVRSGQYVRTAQVVLSLGALAALVGMIAAQFSAFARGHLFTAASLGAFVVLGLMAAALTVVVHARLIDAEHGA